jgi:hypothetical protein
MEPVTAMFLLGGLNAGMGAMKAAQAAKQRQQEANIRAAEIEASPWTGKGPSTQISTANLNPWAEMAGGAINAAGQVAALQNAGLFKSGDVSNMASSTMTPNTYSQMYNQQNATMAEPWKQLAAQSSYKPLSKVGFLGGE